jgi:signal transduction histidine kinase/CheY-like chemotaxis protein
MTPAQQPARATRVLLVEDNPGDADLVRLSLEGAQSGPFEIDHASRLSEALARLRGTPAPDVVLLDLTLPDAFDLDGLDRLKRAAPAIPIVVLTGADRSLGAAAIHAGAQDYLLKGAEDVALVGRALRYAVERQEHAAHAQLLAAERAARAAAEASRERMAVLAAASTAASHSLEDRHALESLASAVVPRLADFCAIRLREAELDLPEWVTACRDGLDAEDIESSLAAVFKLEPSRDPRRSGAGVTPELHADVGASAAGSPWCAALERLGARSGMVVPIALNGEPLGTIVLGSMDRPFGPDDLVLAEEIGRRAGIAVANCRLYREARLAVAARDEFLSAAAHELRTPVTVLQLKLQQVELKQRASICSTCDRAVPADYAGAAGQIARLGQLIESLLDVSRLASGRSKLEREEVDIGQLACAAIERLAELASRSGSEVTLRCGGPLRGSWDRQALDRVMVNLLSNAIKFGARRPIEVRVAMEGEQAVIEVEDHGIGIAPGDVERIFRQFERAVSARHFGGLGLGLYITRCLVEQHGGRITVSSELGAGSVFTVRLPREARSAPA